MTTEFGEFKKFETITLFPFDLQLFETSIMTDEEIEWVNAYHNKVRTILTPMLDTEEERNWLAEKTQPLTH
jgi:Xaa-Pro aminopeptidase